MSSGSLAGLVKLLELACCLEGLLLLIEEILA